MKVIAKWPVRCNLIKPEKGVKRDFRKIITVITLMVLCLPEHTQSQPIVTHDTFLSHLVYGW